MISSSPVTAAYGAAGGAAPSVATGPGWASGKEADWTAVIIGRFADGRLAEDWVEYDRLGLYRQLGVLPLGG